MKQGLAGTLQPLTVNNIGAQQISGQQQHHQQQHQQQQQSQLSRNQPQQGLMNQIFSSNTGQTSMTYTDSKRMSGGGVGVGMAANTATTTTMPLVPMASCSVCRREYEQNNLIKCTDCLKLFCPRCGQHDPNRQVIWKFLIF